jgi:hypothetical protein
MMGYLCRIRWRMPMAEESADTSDDKKKKEVVFFPDLG